MENAIALRLYKSWVRFPVLAKSILWIVHSTQFTKPIRWTWWAWELSKSLAIFLSYLCRQPWRRILPCKGLAWDVTEQMPLSNNSLTDMDQTSNFPDSCFIPLIYKKVGPDQQLSIQGLIPGQLYHRLPQSGLSKEGPRREFEQNSQILMCTSNYKSTPMVYSYQHNSSIMFT